MMARLEGAVFEPMSAAAKGQSVCAALIAVGAQGTMGVGREDVLELLEA